MVTPGAATFATITIFTVQNRTDTPPFRAWREHQRVLTSELDWRGEMLNDENQSLFESIWGSHLGRGAR